jgi:acid stress chaperone HdeB
MGYRSPDPVNPGLRRARIAPAWPRGEDAAAVLFTDDQPGGFLMIRVLFGAAFVAVMMLAASANAADIDLSTITCKKFLDLDKDNIAVYITWLDGYYKEEKDPPVIDFDSFQKNAQALGQFCRDHPDDGLITAADQTFGKKKK